VVARCIGDTPNSRSCGIVWFVDIPSVYCRSCLPNELGVRDWNCLFEVLAVFLIDIFIFLANEMFLEQRKYDILHPSTLTVDADHAWSQERLGEIPPFRDVGQSSRLLPIIDN
jgi:hypothetical protein